jgi:hypothetical protein
VTRSRALAVTALFLGASSAALCWWAPRLTPRIPSGWSWRSEYVGHQTYADAVTGILPSSDVTCRYIHQMSIVPGSLTDESVRILDRYVLLDLEAGAVLYEYISSALADPRTGARLEPELAGSYLLFPQDVQKTTYSLRMSYLKGVPMAFAGETDVMGLATYHFTYRGRGEYTESYAGTSDYPGVSVPPGHELRCADDRFRYDAWVEPVTGEIVRIAEGCPSGDYIYAIGSDVPLKAIDRWAGETDGNDVAARVDAVRTQRMRHLMLTRAIPLGLLMGSAALAGLAWIARMRQGA